MEADAVDRRDVCGQTGFEVDQVHIVKPTVRREAESLVLLFPSGILRAFPASTDDRQASVGRPARELCPGVWLVGQVRGDELPPGTTSPDDRRAHRDDVRMSSPRQIRAELGVADLRDTRCAILGAQWRSRAARR